MMIMQYFSNKPKQLWDKIRQTLFVVDDTFTAIIYSFVARNLQGRIHIVGGMTEVTWAEPHHGLVRAPGRLLMIVETPTDEILKAMSEKIISESGQLV